MLEEALFNQGFCLTPLCQAIIERGIVSKYIKAKTLMVIQRKLIMLKAMIENKTKKPSFD